jgi:hypothetical protein
MKRVFISNVFFILILSTFCQNEQKHSFTIGEQFGGGIVFYIDPSGKSALIAAPYDQSSRAQWGCTGFIIGASGLTDGESNSKKIVQKCGPGTAAYIWDTLKLSGYYDWYLPSQYELNLLYKNAEILKTLSSGVYCSSTEYNQRNNINNCWVQNFGKMGKMFYWDKNRKYYVRAIRNTAEEIIEEKIATPEKSTEEKQLDRISIAQNEKETLYPDITEVHIGDIVRFKSTYGDLIIGFVIEIKSKNKIHIKTYPTPGSVLVIEEGLNNIKKVELE